MGPISKSQVEHDALVRKLKADINRELGQIHDIINAVENDEYEMYYLYFKLTQLNALLAHDYALMNKKTPVAVGLGDVSLRASVMGA